MKKTIALLALFCVAVFAQNTFTDPRDGKKYKYVKIGSQTWMAQNLNYAAKAKYGGNLGECYDENPANCEKYGRLYDWENAVDLCPKGWHLPNDKEWQILVNFTGGKKVAGKKLKAKSGWEESNGTDDYGFAALPGGYLYRNPHTKEFMGIGNKGLWLRADGCEPWGIKSDNEIIDADNEGCDGDFVTVHSVRCLQD